MNFFSDLDAIDRKFDNMENKLDSKFIEMNSKFDSKLIEMNLKFIVLNGMYFAQQLFYAGPYCENSAIGALICRNLISYYYHFQYKETQFLIVIVVNNIGIHSLLIYSLSLHLGTMHADTERQLSHCSTSVLDYCM